MAFTVTLNLHPPPPPPPPTPHPIPLAKIDYVNAMNDVKLTNEVGSLPTTSDVKFADDDLVSVAWRCLPHPGLFAAYASFVLHWTVAVVFPERDGSWLDAAIPLPGVHGGLCVVWAIEPGPQAVPVRMGNPECVLTRVSQRLAVWRFLQGELAYKLSTRFCQENRATNYAHVFTRRAKSCVRFFSPRRVKLYIMYTFLRREPGCKLCTSFCNESQAASCVHLFAMRARLQLAYIFLRREPRCNLCTSFCNESHAASCVHLFAMRATLQAVYIFLQWEPGCKLCTSFCDESQAASCVHHFCDESQAASCVHLFAMRARLQVLPREQGSKFCILFWQV